MNATPPSVVERLLSEQIGLDPSSVGDRLIARGVHARMTALGTHSKADYERILQERPAELQALVEEVVVSESWFFRDERPFEVLERFACEGWIADLARPPLTVLCVPCASGEEPYSVAMTLLEAGLSAERFRVDAVDISARSIARAIAGVYGSNAFRGEASARRSSYFREQGSSFTLDLAVRSTVRFRLGNVLDPTLFADRGAFDVVFCRNLLIYLDDEAKARAFASLTRLVADGGLLFLGHADRLEWLDDAGFLPMTEKGAFGYRKGKPKGKQRPSKFGSVPLPLPDGGFKIAPVVSKPTGLNSVKAARAPTPSLPGPPPQEVREIETKAKPQTKTSEPPSTLLDRASALADSGNYAEAKPLVEQAISSGQANARAFFLSGMIAQAAGLRDQAEVHYLKAIYLDPQQDEALLALALLARRKGDVAAEAGYRRRAERVLARKVVP